MRFPSGASSAIEAGPAFDDSTGYAGSSSSASTRRANGASTAHSAARFRGSGEPCGSTKPSDGSGTAAPLAAAYDEPNCFMNTSTPTTTDDGQRTTDLRAEF